MGIEHPVVLSEPHLHAIVLSIKKGFQGVKMNVITFPVKEISMRSSRSCWEGHKSPVKQFFWCHYTPLGEPRKDLFAEVLNLQKSFPDC